MNDDNNSSFWPSLQRGIMLRHTGRFAEAEKYIQSAIAVSPDNAEGYHHLAFCYCNWDGHSKKALATIDRAISLTPYRSDFFALRAWILVNLNKHKQALKAAEEALAIDPGDILAWNAQTRAHCARNRWKDMEASARATLEFDPNNDLALNFHAIALRHLGRRRESEQVIAQLLARVPEDPVAQTNAGWAALEAGDHRRANLHFLDALRLDPHYEYARQGLLHSFNSRVWFYRIYLSLISRLSRIEGTARYAVLIAIYLLYRTVVTTLEHNFGRLGMELALVIIAMYIITFVFGRSFGNLFLLLDRFARHALTTREKCWSAVAGCIYGLLVFAAYSEGFWIPFALMLVPPACFLWSVLTPRMQDLFSPRPAEPALD